MTVFSAASMVYTAAAHAGPLDAQVFNDRQHYSAVLLQQGRVQLDADWNEESPGTIKVGQEFGQEASYITGHTLAVAGGR